MMILRPFASGDLEPVVEPRRRAWSQTFPDVQHPHRPEQWLTRLRDKIAPRQAVWLALHGAGAEAILGFVSLVVADGYLDQLFVDPGAQGRGVGAALIKKAKELAPGGISLHTLQRNSPPRAFYERHGFRSAEIGVNPVNGLPNVWYRWTP